MKQGCDVRSEVAKLKRDHRCRNKTNDPNYSSGVPKGVFLVFLRTFPMLPSPIGDLTLLLSILKIATALPVMAVQSPTA
jgi:hypothetical protein